MSGTRRRKNAAAARLPARDSALATPGVAALLLSWPAWLFPDCTSPHAATFPIVLSELARPLPVPVARPGRVRTPARVRSQPSGRVGRAGKLSVAAGRHGMARNRHGHGFSRTAFAARLDAAAQNVAALLAALFVGHSVRGRDRPTEASDGGHAPRGAQRRQAAASVPGAGDRTASGRTRGMRHCASPPRWNAFIATR